MICILAYRYGINRWLILILLCAGHLFGSIPVLSQVAINEVMSNAPGRESGSGSPGDRMEFIELFNCFEEATVDLDGWSISDGDADDFIRKWERSPEDSIGSVIVLSETTLLRPGRFALILDPEYFHSGEGGWYTIEESTLVVTVDNTTLGNGLSSRDPVILFNPMRDTISTFGTPGWDDGFPGDPGDGVSWERIYPEGEDEEANWTISRDPYGSTPGRQNSLSVPIDISVSDSSLTIDPLDPEEGGLIDVTGLVINQGILDTPSFEVHFFLDHDHDGRIGEMDIQQTIAIGDPISPGDSLYVSGRLRLGGIGYFNLGIVAVHPDDGDTTDNIGTREVKVGDAASRIILNEIYYDPLDGGEEWVEIFNRSDRSLDLMEWKFSDVKSVGQLLGDSVILEKESYAVLTRDRTALVVRFPEVLNRQIIEVAPFPSLGNRGDTLSLTTVDGYVSDRIEYTPQWGGRKGVSLERVNPYDTTTGPSNWGSSVDPGGSTPGVPNSIYQEIKNEGASLWTTPEIFSPDGDGRDDRVVIGYLLPVPRARVKVEIYSILGYRVKVVLDQIESGSEGIAVWDGKDEKGSILPVGIYVVYLEAIDPFSGYLLQVKRGVVLGGKL
jgi:hypothetical protein